MKLFIILVTYLSGIAMYFFTKEVTKNKKIALIASIFYLFAPYRFTDMYLRNALAELTSFVFLPMVFHGLYGVLKEKTKREYLLIIGSIGLLLTHTIITMYTAIICFIYLITQIKHVKKKQVRNKILISLFIIVIITSFFTIPLLEHKLNADYEVFKPGRMERTDVLIAFKLSFSDLFITKSDNIMIYEIGLVSVILLILSPIVIKKLRKKWKHTDFYRFYIFSLIVGIICSVMTLKIFPFERLPSILKMLQFSFRLLEFSSFFFAFISAVNLGMLIKKIKYKDVLMLIVILTLLSSLFISHIHFVNGIDESKLWPAVRVTSQTGRVHAGCASFEYLPSKAFENRSYIETRSDEVLILQGSAQIEEQNKENTNLSLKVSYVIEETKLELPYIYYLGYEVTLEQNGETIKLETYETENGFVGVTIPVLEEAAIKVNYEGTFLMKASGFISILGIITLIGYMIRQKVKK